MCVRWSNALYWQWHLWHFRVCVVVNTWKPYYSLMILLRAFHKRVPLRIGPEIPITSIVTSTVNLLLVVAIKIICSCFSQPLYLKAAVLTLSRLTWHALLDLSSEPSFVVMCLFWSRCVKSNHKNNSFTPNRGKKIIIKQVLKSIFSAKSVKLLSTLGKVSFQWKFLRMLSQCWAAL